MRNLSNRMLLYHEFDPETQEWFVSFRGVHPGWQRDIFDSLLSSVFDDAWKALANRKEGQTVEEFLDWYQHCGEYGESFLKYWGESYEFYGESIRCVEEWFYEYIYWGKITSILTEASKGNYNISTIE